jgi:hypothetical protein
MQNGEECEDVQNLIKQIAKYTQGQGISEDDSSNMTPVRTATAPTSSELLTA